MYGNAHIMISLKITDATFYKLVAAFMIHL